MQANNGWCSNNKSLNTNKYASFPSETNGGGIRVSNFCILGIVANLLLTLCDFTRQEYKNRKCKLSYTTQEQIVRSNIHTYIANTIQISNMYHRKNDNKLLLNSFKN